MLVDRDGEIPTLYTPLPPDENHPEVLDGCILYAYYMQNHALTTEIRLSEPGGNLGKPREESGIVVFAKMRETRISGDFGPCGETE